VFGVLYGILQIFVSLTNVILLAVFEVCLSRKLMSFFPLDLRVEPSESIALHLLVAHDETSRQIAIYNNDCKIALFSHSIL